MVMGVAHRPIGTERQCNVGLPDRCGVGASRAFAEIRKQSMLSDYPAFPILLAKDLDAARDYYHGLLGLPILREDPDDRIVFGTAGGRVVVTKSTTGTSDSQTQMAWSVPDIRATVFELRSRGVKIEDYVAPDPVTDDGVADMGHSWAAWFIDPFGNALAVVQPKG